MRQIAESRPAEEALKTLERFTGFPEPLFAESETRLRRWSRSHEQLIVREELRDLTRIRELGLIESLVGLLPERIGSPLSINALRQDLGVRFETVQNWLAALGRLFFLFTIRPYAGKLARTLRREEKAYLFDFSTIHEQGPRFENLVALHLLKLCNVWTDFGYGDFALCYVRDREKREVDFLITDRLKPRYSLQIVRTPEGFKSAFMTDGILLAPASQALASRPTLALVLCTSTANLSSR